MSSTMFSRPLPKYQSIRRVPSRCQRMLPLRLMQRYRCIVVGTARDGLTVAIADEQQRRSIELLERLTGYPIFTVLVDPARMNLLLARQERRERQQRSAVVGHPYYLHGLQLRAYVNFILEYLLCKA